MALPLKILFVSSEVTPFAKTGGLADVSSALPKAIKEAGHDIRVFMPKYAAIKDRKFILRDVIRLKDMVITHGSHPIKLNIKSSFIPDSKVQVYFLDYPPYFERDELYVDPKTGTDFVDNPERFALFSRTAIEMLKRLHWQPDVIHCNDWQTSLIPVFLKVLYVDDEFYQSTRTLLSVHNLAYQGIFPAKKLAVTGLSEKLYNSGGALEFFGRLNFLKAGLEYADLINTVSPTYAKEIQTTNEFGYGLEGILKRRTEQLFGILNGVDYSEWSPDVDPWIPLKYDFKTVEDKIENKKHLLKLCNLPFDPAVPCIGAISRLADQKGFDLIFKAIDKILKLKVQFIILGKGEEKYHQFFSALQKKYPTQVSVHLKFDNQLAHLIEAGCDLFLMPSKYEPCGLNQLYSLKYGTIPIVRATGGLMDTVTDFSANPKHGTGFVFQKYNAREMLTAIRNAIATFQNRTIWREMIIRAMKQIFSWEVSSHEYIKLYLRLSKKK